MHMPAARMDDLDRAQQYEEQERAAAISRRTRPQSPKIDLRRTRLCADCGERILRARLRAMPATTRCAWCQGIHEQRMRT